MVAARHIVFAVGALFSIWCVLVAAITLAGKNVATRHLISLYPLAYAAIYLVLSPFGLSGILGALNRKKSLIKGFILQYWICTLLLTAVNCVSVYWAHELATSTNRQCQNQNQGEGPISALNTCNKLIKTSQLTSLIFTCVQGGIMITFGILVVVFGLREAEDIKIDEETSNLLDKAAHETNHKPNNNLTELRNVHRSNSNSSSTYNQSNLSRNITNASNNYSQSNLSRNTTNASNYRPNHQNPNIYNGLNRNVNNNPSLKYGDLRPPPINTTNIGLNRLATNYTSRPRNQVPPPGHENVYMRAPLQAYTNKPQQIPTSYDQSYVDDYQHYWQPTIANTMANDLTRKGLY